MSDNMIDDDRLAKAESALARIIDRLEQTDEYDSGLIDVSVFNQLARALDAANAQRIAFFNSLVPWDKDEKFYICLVCAAKSKIRLTIPHPQSCPIYDIWTSKDDRQTTLETTHSALDNLLMLIAQGDLTWSGGIKAIVDSSIYDRALAVVKANFKDYGLPTTLAFVKDEPKDSLPMSHTPKILSDSEKMDIQERTSEINGEE